MNDEQIAALRCWSGDVEIAPLAGGITNRNFLVRDGGDRFVVRLCEDRRFLGIDRTNERLCQTAAQRAGVSPELVHAESGILVTRYIDGETLEGRPFDADLISQLANLLRRLHDARDELTGEMLFFCPFQTVRTYVSTARQIGAALPADVDDLLAWTTRLSRELSAYRPTLCHNDLLPANILDDSDRLWLIDWEYAGIGNPLFDLASVSANCQLDIGQTGELLRAWSGTVDSRLMGQIAVHKRASILREALWAVIQTVQSKIDYDYVRYARDSFEGFRQSLNSLPPNLTGN